MSPCSVVLFCCVVVVVVGSNGIVHGFTSVPPSSSPPLLRVVKGGIRTHRPSLSPLSPHSYNHGSRRPLRMLLPANDSASHTRRVATRPTRYVTISRRYLLLFVDSIVAIDSQTTSVADTGTIACLHVRVLGFSCSRLSSLTRSLVRTTITTTVTDFSVRRRGRPRGIRPVNFGCCPSPDVPTTITTTTTRKSVASLCSIPSPKPSTT